MPVFLRQMCVDSSYAWCLDAFGARFDEFFFGDRMKMVWKLMSLMSF